jgi:dihydrofolate reductase
LFIRQKLIKSIAGNFFSFIRPLLLNQHLIKMSKIQLYIAATLDGFIAREDGNLDWLTGYQQDSPNDYGYTEFISGIDTIVMGRKTYEEILKFGINWLYSDCKTYIVTKNPDFKIQTENTYLLDAINPEIIEEIKNQAEKNIWIAGGGQIIAEFLKYRAFDELILCLVPKLLSKGIPLFTNYYEEMSFKLINLEKYDTGICILSYIKI